MIPAPRDPFSEVVDERRRWMPDWYTWLSEFVLAVTAIETVVDGLVITVADHETRIDTLEADDVTGPGSATDDAVARFDGTTGKLIQNSSFLVDDSGNVSAFGGQVAFPATQNSSSDVNTLDDYEEFSWTPVVTFATPGTFSTGYAVQVARGTKIGRLVHVSWVIVTSGWSLGTASGNLQVTGAPFAAVGIHYGAFSPSGLTKAGYTNFVSTFNNAAEITFQASGSGVSSAMVVAADFTAGGNVVGSITYTV